MYFCVFDDLMIFFCYFRGFRVWEVHIVRARYFFLGPRELVSGDTPARVTDFILVLLCSSVRDNHATPSSAQWLFSFFFLFRKREGMHVLGCERGAIGRYRWSGDGREWEGGEETRKRFSSVWRIIIIIIVMNVNEANGERKITTRWRERREGRTGNGTRAVSSDQGLLKDACFFFSGFLLGIIRIILSVRTCKILQCVVAFQFFSSGFWCCSMFYHYYYCPYLFFFETPFPPELPLIFDFFLLLLLPPFVESINSFFSNFFWLFIKSRNFFGLTLAETLART